MMALKLDRVRKTFAQHIAVDGVSAEIPVGSLCGFIGPNGAGKTTILRIVVDIIRPDEGTVEVLGERNPAAIRSRIGYLPEERGMYKKMRCTEFIAYIGALKGLPLRSARERAAELMERFDLGKWKNATVDALSKGMQQKLQFVSTIIHEPELLILDEPFSGLDPVNLEVLKQAMLEYRRQGRTIIFSTHMMEQAERLCDAILMIHNGQKVLDGSISSIKSAAPRRAVHLRADGDGSFIKDLPMVDRVREYGNDKEVFLHSDGDPQALLAALVGKVKVRTFDVSEPSLYDIFLEKAGVTRGQQFTDSGDLVDKNTPGLATAPADGTGGR
jgi:ABC-2 type transport system ATP-binding protein